MWTLENILYLLFILLAILSGFIRIKYLRWLIMLSALVFLGFLQMGCPSPLGAIQNLCAKPLPWATSQVFLVKLAIVTIPAFFFGPIFCGKVCPKGTIQELLYRKEFKVHVPDKLDLWLRRLPYVVLFAVILSPIIFHYKLFNSHVSPFKVIFNLMGSPFAVGFIGVILLSSVFMFRPFCSYICPVGAWLKITTWLGIHRLKVSCNCTGCSQCAKNCEMGALSAPKKGGENYDLDVNKCIACGMCQQYCKKHCLS